MITATAKPIARRPNLLEGTTERKARSLMARAGVADNIAERVLGHVIAGGGGRL